MEIKREFYLKELVDRLDNGLIKIVTGIRRCGKSYLLDPIFKNYLIENGVSKDHIIKLEDNYYDDNVHKQKSQLLEQYLC